MTELDDRFAAALDHDELHPTAIDAIRRRTTTRRRRRDLTVVVASVILIGLGITPLLRPGTEPSTAPSTASELGLQSPGSGGGPGPMQSCSSVSLDILVAHAGVAFVGRPVAERVEEVPTPAMNGVPPEGAAARVVWTFDDVVALKGAVPRTAEVTVEWLDAQGLPMTPHDPNAELTASQGRAVGVLANRLGSTDALMVATTCGGYTVPAAELATVTIDPGTRAPTTATAVAIAAVRSTHSGQQVPAIVALDAGGRPVAYGDGPVPLTLTACPGAHRFLSITDPTRDDLAVVVWDTATLAPVRTDPLPTALDASTGWTLACLDPDASRVVVAQIGNHARIAVRSADGSWSVSDERPRIAAAVVLRDPEVVVLATSDWGPKLTTVDLATRQPIAEGSLGPEGDVTAGAPDPDGRTAVFTVTNGVPSAPGAPPTGGRLQTVTPAGETNRTTAFVEGPARGALGLQPFVDADGSVTVALEHGGADVLARFAADGGRTDIAPAGVEDIDRLLWVGAGRAWTQLSTTALDPHDGTDRVIWPFGATVVVGLPAPTAIDPSAIDRGDPYAPLDAGFAMATEPDRTDGDERAWWATALAVVLVGAGALGLASVARGRFRRRPASA